MRMVARSPMSTAGARIDEIDYAMKKEGVVILSGTQT